MKKIKTTVFFVVALFVLLAVACCLYYKCGGIDKVVVPRHIALDSSLYVVVMEKPYKPDTLYKEVYFKEKKK